MKARLLMPVLALAAFDLGIAQAADARRCVHFRDLQAFSKVNETTLVARPKNRSQAKAYEIKMTAKCNYDWPSGNHFITVDSSPWECLEPGDHLRLQDGGSCVVSQITAVTEQTSQ